MESLKKLVVHGTKEVNLDGSITYSLESSNRDADNRNEISLVGNNELLELTLSDDEGTSWVVDKNTMHELFPGMDPAIPGSQHRGEAGDEFVLPGSMDAPATERGIVGKIALKLLTVFKKKDVVKSGVGVIAERLEDKHLLNNLPENENSPIRKKLKARKFLEKGVNYS